MPNDFSQSLARSSTVCQRAAIMQQYGSLSELRHKNKDHWPIFYGRLRSSSGLYGNGLARTTHVEGDQIRVAVKLGHPPGMSWSLIPTSVFAPLVIKILGISISPKWPSRCSVDIVNIARCRCRCCPARFYIRYSNIINYHTSMEPELNHMEYCIRHRIGLHMCNIRVNV